METVVSISAILSTKSPEVWSVNPTTTVFEAVQMMAEKNIGAVPVLDNGRLAGVFSERDYTRKIVLKGRTSRVTPVCEVLTTPVVVISPQDTIETALRLMTEHRVRHLPVLDGERLAGIISIGDLVKWIISAQTATIDHLENYIAGTYPG
jgi:CBS domain-containing protein